jgi:hypothetical protein
LSLSATYEDLRREGVFSPRLLAARLHHNSREFPATYEPLGQAIESCGGSQMIGDEPPGAAYNDTSECAVLKTGSLQQWRLSVDDLSPRTGHVPPYAFSEQDLRAGDILIAKDGPVGQVGVLQWPGGGPVMISSGIVAIRLPVASLFYLAILKFGPFTSEIGLLAPTGSTYRHAGRELLLSSMVPKAGTKPDVEARLSSLSAIVLGCEREIRRRFHTVIARIDEWLGVSDEQLEPAHTVRSFAELSSAGRWDARYHVAAESELQRKVRRRSRFSLAELVDQGAIVRRREQNLQYTAIGNSAKHDDPRAGSYRLLEPNFIGLDFSVHRHRWLWCPRRLKTIEDGSVLMSAEGSIGLVTVFRIEADVRTVSNIHAISMRWTDAESSAVRNSLLAANLAYLRAKGLLDAYSVGGQGGSLSHRYHDLVPILDHDDELAAWCHTALAAGPPPASVDALKLASADDLNQMLLDTAAQSVARLDELRRNAGDAARETIAREYPEL